MRIVLMEGFDYYADTTQLFTRWNPAGAGFSLGYQAPGLGGEGQSFHIAAAVFWEMQYAFENAQKITLHFGMMPGLRESNWAQFMEMRTNLNAHQWGLGMDAAGHLVLYGEGNVVIATGELVLPTNLAHRICVSADLTNGHFRCSVNGEEDMGLHLDAADIQDDATAYMGLLVFGRAAGNTNGNHYYLDDVILGIDECVDWGPLEINTMVPTADILAQWSRSTGANNYANVDETVFNGDVDYNYDTVVGHMDIFDYTNPPHVPETTLAVQLVTYARKEESAVRKFREILRVGGVDYDGDEHNLVEQYAQYTSIWMVNPTTLATWTPAELNALQGGYEYTV